MEFDIGTLSLIVIFGLLALISIGVPLGFASGFMGAVVVFLNIGEHALGILLSRYYSLVVTYSFLSVPLFIFMASLLERSNIARDLYDALNAWLRKTRGGVGVVTAIMATIMAAMSGIIGGEIVLLGLIALPQMLRLKYDQDMSIGIICASGSLGTMIPPSIVLIIYGLTTETSITMLFQEAIVPGLMISGLIISYILVRTRLQPHLAPISDEPPLTFKEKMSYLPGLLPPIGIVIIVLGSIYSGITGITEAAGPNGGLKNETCIFTQNKIPNHMGSKPRARTIGKNTGIANNTIPTQSINAPNIKNIICIIKIRYIGFKS